MFVTCEEKCFKLTREKCEEVQVLRSNHEEADTRLFLHAQHAAAENYQAIVLVADDTDVFIICLGLSSAIKSKVFIRRGTKARVRMIDITKIAAALGHEVCSALPGLHAWTGCDTISALASQGKMKGLQIVRTNQIFRNAFVSLGASWNLTQDVFNQIQEFTCLLYSKNTKICGVNDLRYNMFCARKGDVESGQLPPCADTLLQHTLRANYQAAIWRRSLECFPDIPKPSEGHGWELNSEGELIIQWMTGLPAPDVVLSLISCKCARSCRQLDCSCMIIGLKCTAACKLQSCTNMAQEDDDYDDGADIEQDSDDCDSDCDNEED